MILLYWVANSSTQVPQRRAANRVCRWASALCLQRSACSECTYPPPRKTFSPGRQLLQLSHGNNVLFSNRGSLCRIANWEEEAPSHSLYIKIWLTVMKETEKTCSAVAEKWSMLWITHSPRWIASPAVVHLKRTTTEHLSQEAKYNFQSNLSVWMRTPYCGLSKLVDRWYKVTFMLLVPALLLPCIYVAKIYRFPVLTLPKQPWAAPVCMCALQP